MLQAAAIALLTRLSASLSRPPERRDTFRTAVRARQSYHENCSVRRMRSLPSCARTRVPPQLTLKFFVFGIGFAYGIPVLYPLTLLFFLVSWCARLAPSLSLAARWRVFAVTLRCASPEFPVRAFNTLCSFTIKPTMVFRLALPFRAVAQLGCHLLRRPVCFTVFQSTY
eukprot:6203264-Pleurochrysis_carterae.AAC.3